MKFINLLQKELKELINGQMILSLAVILAMLFIMGNITKSAINDVTEEAQNPKINISDRDDTDFTQNLIEVLKNSGAEIKVFETDGDNYADILSENDIKNIVIIPKGFTDSIENGEKPEIITASRMTSAATLSNISTGTSGAITLIQNCIANTIATEAGMSPEQFELMENPIMLTDNE